MPSVRFANNFFLVLTLLADAAVVLGIVGALAAAASRRAREVVLGAVELVGPWSITIAFVVAAVTTAGSLYYSESAGFTPCELCWYQRIVMYPLVVVLLVAWLRRDRAAWITAAPFVVIGAPLSFYHWLVERVPSLAEGISCSLDAPCAVPYFQKLGFVTLAWMCMSSFLLIGTLLVSHVAYTRIASAPAPGPEGPAGTVAGGPRETIEEPV
jgi:disulfide bond formation protein DsbB